MISFELAFFLACLVFVLGGIAVGVHDAREDDDDIDRRLNAMHKRIAEAEAADADQY